MTPSASGRRSRAGSFLLICMALVTAMVAVAFAFVSSMRIATEIGPSNVPGQLAREAARAGIAHAGEVLVRDYLQRPLVPTSDTSPHALLFAPIDNVNSVNPRDASATTDDLSAWNDNDLLPAAKILNPYMTFDPKGRVYAGDNSWQNSMVSNSCPRYIEPSYWTIDLERESDPSNLKKLDFTKTPATAPAVDRPLYFDAAWRPVLSREEARYRLRYAVMCEDLSGHILSGLQAGFGRDDNTLPDGDPRFAGKRGQGTEFDAAWAKRYVAAFAGFFQKTGNHVSSDALSPLHGTGLWMGYSNTGDVASDGYYNRSMSSMGFTETGNMQGVSAWVWGAIPGEVGGDSISSPRSNALIVPAQIRPYPTKLHTWQAMMGLYKNVFGGSWNNKGALTPYGAPTMWNRSPDPETAVFNDYAYNEGMTDCPWRINPLTAPKWTLASVISAFRTPPLWEAAIRYRVFYKYIGLVNGNPVWEKTPIKDPGDPSLPLVETINPPLSSNLAFPNPFRASFTTKLRGGHTLVQPFAQFPASRTADNPRSRTDPCYPSPIATWYPDDLGRFSMLYAGDHSTFAASTSRALGACMPRYDVEARSSLSFSPFDFSKDEDKRNYNNAVMDAPNPLEVRFCSSPITYNELDPTKVPIRDLHPDAYWHDASVALASSLAVAIAASQPPLPTGEVKYPPMPTVDKYEYPPHPTGWDSVLFGGRWGKATRDTDTDGDGFNETAGAFTNVGDLDRLFLLLLGEDPDRPGDNPVTRSAIFAVQKGTTSTYSKSPFTPTLVNLPAYDPVKPDWSSAMETGWSQDPYDQSNTKLMNLRRASLRGIRLGLYENDATHPADSTAYLNEAVALVRGASGPSPMVLEKLRQLRRCRLRDAERIINDMRMSFFGANLRYQDRTRTGHASAGRFRPYDLDGDGWAICSAYCPSAVTQVEAITVPAYPMQDPTIPGKKIPYIFSEPTDPTRMVFDDAPDNPNNVALTPGPAQSYWVCFKDVDTTVATNLVTDLTLSDFKDCITYTKTLGDDVNGVDRAGYTRWYYPASRVIDAVNADDGAVTDGVALVPPDTYFSLTGHFVLEKSHFYRLFSRGEVWDEWKGKSVDFSILESVLQLDPNGDVLTRPNNIDPATRRILDSTGLQDTGIIFQRWGQSLYQGGKDRAGETR